MLCVGGGGLWVEGAVLGGGEEGRGGGGVCTRYATTKTCADTLRTIETGAHVKHKEEYQGRRGQEGTRQTRMKKHNPDRPRQRGIGIHIFMLGVWCLAGTAYSYMSCTVRTGRKSNPNFLFRQLLDLEIPRGEVGGKLFQDFDFGVVNNENQCQSYEWYHRLH